jgi:hypothetical protein
MSRTHSLAILCALLAEIAGSGSARAQHFDVLAQQVAGKIVTGAADFDSGQWTLGRRVYSGEFDDDFAVNNPGFNALGAGAPTLPAGSQALPANSGLSWDFWPMRIDDFSSNLFYWDGAESDSSAGLTPNDVRFGALPGPNYQLSLFDKSNGKFSVDGSDQAIPGGIIDDTAADGSLHRHRFFFLEDGDGNAGTDPADGIYLISLRLRMNGLVTSDPLYIVFGTLGSSVEALDDAAVPWVETNADTLVLLGDYNKNGVVEAADYTVWRNTLDQSGFALPGDGDASGAVDRPDHFVWRENYGKESPTLGSGASGTVASLPEPSAIILAVSAVFGCLFRIPAIRYRAPGCIET